MVVFGGKTPRRGALLAWFCLLLVACGDTGATDGGADTSGDTGADTVGTGDTSDSTGGGDGDSGGDGDVDERGESAVIDEEGGSVEVVLEEDEGEGSTEVEVEVPPGAVEESVEVRVEPVEATDVAAIEGEAELASEPVAFLPHGTTFDVPVTISFTAPGGFSSDAVIVRLEDENDTEWELLSSDVQGDTISVEVTTFSIYAVVEGTLCHEGNPDSDSDGVCDAEDICPADPNDDSDSDGVCDSEDPCPADRNDDSDSDGVCDSEDPCPADPNDDSDSDEICDSEDSCPADPQNDGDGNGICDGSEARIAGVVTKNGVPVANAFIQVYDQLQNQVANLTADEAGAYFVGELPGGTYDIYTQSETECALGYLQVTVELGALASGDIAANCF